MKLNDRIWDWLFRCQFVVFVSGHTGPAGCGDFYRCRLFRGHPGDCKPNANEKLAYTGQTVANFMNQVESKD